LISLVFVTIPVLTGVRSGWSQLLAECLTFIAFLFILRRYARVSILRALGTYLLSSVIGVVITLIAVWILIVPIRMFVVAPFEIRGDSMLPAYQSGDLLLVDKLAIRSHTPQRKEVAVIIPNDQPGQYYVERVIGLPGEDVQIASGQVMIYDTTHSDGYVLPEPYLFKQAATEGLTTARIHVPEGTYFVLGDDREHSNDSRYWGMVPTSNIVGIVIGRIWPPRP
jgi:signal peptidase I